MNSKIFKKPPEKIEITDPRISALMLAKKLESWCEVEPSVLIWEVSHTIGPVRQFLGAEQRGLTFNDRDVREASGHWRVEFQFVRATTRRENGLFDGVMIIAGSIKNSLEIVGEGNKARSQEAYLLSLNSRNLRAEKTFSSAIDLWRALTTIGG